MTCSPLTDESIEEDEDEEGFGSDEEIQNVRTALILTKDSEVGKLGHGRKYTPNVTTSELYKFNFLGVPFGELGTRNEDPDSESDTDEPEAESPSSASDNSKRENFVKEVQATVLRALEDDHTIENAILEVNGLKFSFDASFEECKDEEN